MSRIEAPLHHNNLEYRGVALVELADASVYQGLR